MPDDITAKSLTLVDASGRPRIIMNAGGADGYANVTVVSATGERLEISAQPNGTVALSFDQPPRLGLLTLTKEGFDLRAADGKFAVTIGDILGDGVVRIVVYREGQAIWKQPLDETTSNV